MIKILSVFVLLSLEIFAQVNLSQKINFNEFLDKALKNSSYLKSLNLNINQASQEGKILTRYKNPSLDLEYAQFTDAQGRDDSGYRVAVSQEINLWNVSNDKEEVSASKKEKAQAEYLLVYAQLRKDISVSFAKYSQEKALYILAKQELLIAQRIYAIAKERYKLGTISRGENLQAKVDFELANISLEVNQLSYREKYFKLLETAGYFYEIKLNHQHTFSLTSDLDSNPNIALLEKNQELDIRMAKLNAHKVEAIALVAEFENEPEDDILRLGVSLPLAIFNTKDEELEIAKIKAQKNSFLIKRHSNKIAFEVLHLKQKRELLIELKHKSEATLVTQNELLLMFEDAYKIASINLLELQNIKNKLIGSKKYFIQNKFALDINAINLNYILGGYNE